MHTDEYEISLSRELAVCRAKIRDIEASLAAMERKYSLRTSDFVESLQSGRTAGTEEDSSVWLAHYEALRKWQDLQSQYEAVLRMMKI